MHATLEALVPPQHRAAVEEARIEYRTALATREAEGDEEGAALTFGNLARLELENGNWLAAREAFQKDHDIVLRKSPGSLRLRGQLLTHLGECERALGRYAPKGAAIRLQCFDVMGEARDASLTDALQAELVASADAVKFADAGDLAAARAALQTAQAHARATPRETGYRLRLAALDTGDPIVRLSEK